MTDDPQDAGHDEAAPGLEPAEIAPNPPAEAPLDGPPAPPVIADAAAEPPLAPAFEPVEPSGWAAVAATPPKPAGPMLRVVIPLLLLVAAIALRVFTAYRVNGAPTSGYEAGYLAGSAIGILIVAGIVFLIARHFVGRANPARYRLIATAATLIFTIVTSAATIGASITPAADPSTAMVIAPPYTLTAPTAQVEQTFAGAANGKVAVAVKMVTDTSGTNIGIIVATEGEQSDAFWKSFDSSFPKNTSGGSTTAITFHGSAARLFHANDVSGYAYVESGSILVAVYAKSDATALSIAEAQFQAMAAPSPTK